MGLFVNRARAALLAACVCSAGNVFAAGSAIVSSPLDSGPGTLREAIEVQQANLIVIPDSVGDITIASTLTYSAETPLGIYGSGQTVSTAANTTLLEISDGANLLVSNLNFAGPGGFDIENRGDLGPEPAGKGIFVDVRDDQTGIVQVLLQDVAVSGVANHGVHISDCSLADDCGGGSGGGGEGSEASVVIYCDGCTIDDVGNGKFDADGIRVDDRGAGSIYAIFKDSSFTNVGADGTELDEGNDGDVYALVENSEFSDNGNYCNEDIIGPFIPNPDEMEFELADEVTVDEIPTDEPGSPDDGCIEREVDFFDGTDFVEAYEFGIDLDDGFDIDEAGEGLLLGALNGVVINDNLDEGIDFDEEDGGDIIFSFNGTSASGNKDDAYKLSEEDEGGVFGFVGDASATDNGGKGFVFEEADEGDLAAEVSGTTAAGNDDSDETGIEAVQEDDGTGALAVSDSDISDGFDLDGVDLFEF